MLNKRLLKILHDEMQKNEQTQQLPIVTQSPEPDTVAPEAGDANPPPLGTVIVKRRDLGLQEVSTGQYFFPSDETSGTFKMLPAKPPTSNEPQDTPIWILELGIEGLGVAPLQLQINGPVVIGRGDDADLSLADYNAIFHGISRKHAMLRPSKRALYFIDLDSRNGSRINGIDIRSSSAATLNLGDVIRLGTLTLVIRRIEQLR